MSRNIFEKKTPADGLLHNWAIWYTKKANLGNKMRIINMFHVAALFILIAFPAAAEWKDFHRVSMGVLYDRADNDDLLEEWSEVTPFVSYPSKDVFMDDWRIVDVKSGGIRGKVQRLPPSTGGVATCIAIVLRGLDSENNLFLIGLGHDSGISDKWTSAYFEDFIRSGKKKLKTIQILLFSAMSGANEQARIVQILHNLTKKQGIKVEEGNHAMELYRALRVPAATAQPHAFTAAKEYYQQLVEIIHPPVAIMINAEGQPLIAFEEPEVPFSSGAVMADFLGEIVQAQSLTAISTLITNKTEAQRKRLNDWILVIGEKSESFLMDYLRTLVRGVKGTTEKLPLSTAPLTATDRQAFEIPTYIKSLAQLFLHRSLSPTMDNAAQELTGYDADPDSVDESSFGNIPDSVVEEFTYALDEEDEEDDDDSDMPDAT